MKWHFRTIGMGSINYRSAARRLAREAANTGLFQTSIGLNERDFRNRNPIFWGDHRNVLHPRVPGFGWWVWKPYFILDSLTSIPEGDGLLYLDAGSVIKSDRVSLVQIKDYMELTSIGSILGSNSDFFPEEMYTSADLLEYFNLTDQQRRESQYCAAVLFVVNNDKGRAFIKEWCRLVCIDDHRWLLPREPDTLNHKNFKHHMHDQSSFSCLMKVSGGSSISTGNRDVDGAIRLARHRYGYKYQETRRIIRIFFQCIGMMSRLNLAVQHRILKKSLRIRPTPHEPRII